MIRSKWRLVMRPLFQNELNSEISIKNPFHSFWLSLLLPNPKLSTNGDVSPNQSFQIVNYFPAS